MIVLDASAAIAMINGSQEGYALRGLTLQGERIIAPELFKYELLNVVRKYVQGGHISKDIALSWYNTAVLLVDQFFPMDDMGAEILAETLATEHPSYDVSYLVLARRTGSTLFTLDKRLAKVCEQRCVNCVESVTL